MSATTIEIDADGCAVLTTEQSIALARYWTAQGPDVDDALCALSGFEDLDEVVEREDASLDVLARWVLRWAPVVEAATAQADAADDCPRGFALDEGAMNPAGELDAAGWWHCTTLNTEAAVRAALSEKAKVPA